MGRNSIQICVVITTLATLFLISTFICPANCKSVMIKRSTGYCDDVTPCGWYVYKKENRALDYYIKSPCECAPSYKCVRDTDDVSIASYVHRCRLDSYLIDGQR